MTRLSTTRRQITALVASLALVLVSAAIVSGDELLEDRNNDNVAVLQENENEDAQERLDDEAEDAAEAAEDAAEDEQDRLDDEAEATEEADDDCASTEEGSHGKAVCEAAQAWKSAGEDRPPENQGEIVSGVAQQNHGAEILQQKADNESGLPDAADEALSNAGPTGNGPPGDGDDEPEEDEEDEEE